MGGGGGGGGGLDWGGGQDGCEQRIEIFVKIYKKKIQGGPREGEEKGQGEGRGGLGGCE